VVPNVVFWQKTDANANASFVAESTTLPETVKSWPNAIPKMKVIRVNRKIFFIELAIAG
jgi:hypothetical protein